MLKKTNIYNLFAVLTIVLLVWYTYHSIQSLGFETTAGFSYAAITKLAIIAMAIFTIVISRNRIQTNFTILWIFWVVWLFILFFMFGLRGKGIADIFHVTFCPMTFILFYNMSLYSDKISRISFVGFILLYLMSLYLILLNITTIIGVQIGEETAITNIIYWCLCPLPILLLGRKRWVIPIAIGITFIIVILTGKRSATIAIAFIVLAYIINEMKGRFSAKKILGVILLIVALVFLINTYFKSTFIGVMERMADMKDDQGSGRIPLYNDVFDVMKDNTFIDWFLGRGYGSITLTGHTNAHNDALQMLFEYGIVGLVVYGLMIFYILKRLLVLRKQNSVYYIGYASSVILTGMLGLVSNLIVFYSYFSFLCAFWGIIEAKMVQSKSIKSWNINWN